VTAPNNFLNHPSGTRTAPWARLSNRSDGELGQAIVRVVIALPVTIFVWTRAGSPAGSGADSTPALLTGLCAWLALAIGISIVVLIWPASNTTRRVLGASIDVAILTFSLFFAGEAGVGLSLVYLFITFGNGFRYGRGYFRLCQGLSLAGFVLVITAAPWWSRHLAIGFGLLASLTVLSFYVSALASRIAAARASAEQALQDCLERKRDEPS